MWRASIASAGVFSFFSSNADPGWMNHKPGRKSWMGSHHFLTLPPAPNFHLDLLEAVLKFSRVAKLCRAPTRRPTFLVTRKVIVGVWQAYWTNVFLVNEILFCLQHYQVELGLTATHKHEFHKSKNPYLVMKGTLVCIEDESRCSWPWFLDVGVTQRHSLHCNLHILQCSL